MGTNTPTVSIIIPARDASETLRFALESIRDQDYPNIVETIVAAGDPESAAVAENEGARVIDNPSGTTPEGLNLAFLASTGDLVVRCDAQSRLPPGYVRLAVETLNNTGASVVGGMQIPVGSTALQQAIAAAMSSRLGAGDALYRIGGEAGPTETVYLGVFRRSVLTEQGGWNPTYLRAQDYELNHRIRKSGGIVWFQPELEVAYTPRAGLKALSSQYFQYGRWKRRLARLDRSTLRWRQIIPPLVTLTLFLALPTAISHRSAALVPLGYCGSLIMGSMWIESDLGWRKALIPIALAVMHISWGTGFLFGKRGR